MYATPDLQALEVVIRTGSLHPENSLQGIVMGSASAAPPPLPPSQEKTNRSGSAGAWASGEPLLVPCNWFLALSP